ncbi:hypothetical protein VTN02DRAFT_2539 [Thermoascus thermophilus]
MSGRHRFLNHVRHATTAAKQPRGRTLLLTFDAFSTLFHPRQPVAEQYAATAHSFGLSPSVVVPDRLQAAFKDAYKAQSKRRPNYGREDVLRGRYGGPREWWGEVIRGSFTRLLLQEDATGDPVELPDGMVERLLDRFAGRDGYALYGDVMPFFERLKRRRLDAGGVGIFDRIVVGVISNSDDRVPAVLKSLGLTVGDVRADQERSSMDLPGFEERRSRVDADAKGFSSALSSPSETIEPVNDIDMVITSYEAGEEKPHRLIFDVAKRQAQRMAASMHAQPEGISFDRWTCVHVGDDYRKDYRGALDAGWDSFFLAREPTGDHVQPAKKIDTLTELIPQLEGYNE